MKERAEWLEEMRQKSEAIYDRISQGYWEKYGLYDNRAQVEFVQKLIERMPKGGMVLSAACGAGRYDGMLLEAGLQVTGTDQSVGMLGRAEEHFPGALYLKLGLQEIDFDEAFDGIICIDAMENVPPEDWPVIMGNFARALKPGGSLYISVEEEEAEAVEKAFENAKGMGLPAVRGEMADKVDEMYKKMMEVGPAEWDKYMAECVYHYIPTREQVKEWARQSGFSVEAEGDGLWYHHYLMKKNCV